MFDTCKERHTACRGFWVCCCAETCACSNRTRVVDVRRERDARGVVGSNNVVKSIEHSNARLGGEVHPRGCSRGWLRSKTQFRGGTYRAGFCEGDRGGCSR